jgi:hypothetical protein
LLRLVHRKLTVALLAAVAMTAGCAGADDDTADDNPPSDEETEDTQAAADPDPEPEADPEPDFQPWDPGDPSDYIELALGPSGDSDINSAALWIDCRNAQPLLDDMDSIVQCAMPVDDQGAQGFLFSWYEMFDLDYDDPDSPGISAAPLIAAPTMLNTWLSALCESHDLDTVFVAPIAPGYVIAFAGATDDDELRYDAADQVVSYVNRARAIEGLDSEPEQVDVRRCRDIPTD